MSKILNLVECATSNPDTICEDVEMGNIPNYLAQQVLKDTGVRLHGVGIKLTAFAIRHVIKGHGNDKKEKERGQIGVVNSDFTLLDYIIKQPNSIIKGAIVERNKQSIIFLKEVKNINYFVAMALEGKKYEEKLVLKTMYKKPK